MRYPTGKASHPSTSLINFHFGAILKSIRRSPPVRFFNSCRNYLGTSTASCKPGRAPAEKLYPLRPRSAIIFASIVGKETQLLLWGLLWELGHELKQPKNDAYALRQRSAPRRSEHQTLVTAACKNAKLHQITFAQPHFPNRCANPPVLSQ